MTRSHIDDEQRRARLAVRQCLAASARSGDVVSVADCLVALHSSDPASVHLSAAARMPSPEIGPVSVALYDNRSLLRMHGMRRTLWVASVEVARLIHSSTTAALAAREWNQLASSAAASGIDDPEEWVAGARGDTLDALRRLGPTTARRLGKEVPALAAKLTVGAGKYVTQQAAHTRILLNLGFDGEAVRTAPSGTWVSSEYAWAAMDHWLPDGLAGMGAHAARNALAERYLRSFGPVTTADLQWWTGWTMAASRAALHDLHAVEVALDGGGTGWVMPDDVAAVDDPESWVALLPSLDPSAMGWKERGWYLGDLASFGGPLFDRNGNVGPTVWVDGRVVGGWAQRADGTIAVHLLSPVNRKAGRAIEDTAARLASAIGDARVTQRFPTPLHKEMTAADATLRP